jgi:fructose-1,6-bisphosphatase I
MVAAAPPEATAMKMDLKEPVFPEVCEYAGITLSRYVLEMCRANPDKPELIELVSVMTAVERACKTISKLVRTAPIAGSEILGLEGDGGSINVQGEEQKKLDVITNTVLKNALRFSGKMAVLASEEEDEPVAMADDAAANYKFDKEILIEEGQKYVAVFDPLDGSSNVDANIPTGTIFGIYEEPEGCEINIDAGDGVAASDACLAATLQSGNKLVVSGYCLYSAATSFVFSFGGQTCQGFTLDESVGEFVLTQPNMKIPSRGKPIYSVNEANRWDWEPELRDYVTAIQKGEGETGKQYSARYLGSMVGDIHRTLLYGGIFGYPGDTKNPNGKLRLLYEAAPIAFLMEAAGGAAITNADRILEIEPTNVHQRVPCFFGSKDDVKELRSYYK